MTSNNQQKGRQITMNFCNTLKSVMSSNINENEKIDWLLFLPSLTERSLEWFDIWAGQQEVRYGAHVTQGISMKTTYMANVPKSKTV